MVHSKAATSGGTQILTGNARISRITIQGTAGETVSFYDNAGTAANLYVTTLSTINRRTISTGKVTDSSVIDLAGESHDYDHGIGADGSSQIGQTDAAATVGAGNVNLAALAVLICPVQDVPVDFTVSQGLVIKSSSGTPVVAVEYEPIFGTVTQG